MFHTMLAGIRIAIKSQKNSFKNVFIQWHGMTNTTCPNSKAFISVGTSKKNSIYKLQELPVNRVIFFK